MPGELDASLSHEVQSAKYLIVVCSRAARKNSRYLDDELKYFLEGGGTLSRVIPFIVDESRNPVAECFPAYLSELCEKKNLVGVSIYDDGERSALLRIIAAMLGIRREELESDDLRRRKKQRFSAAVLALLLLAGAAVCWDYFRTKTACFTDYTEIYGIPAGIGKLGKNERKSMNAHYVLVSSRGKLRQLRYENSAGYLVPQERTSCLDPFSKAEYEYAGEKLSCVRQYDENGHLTAELHYINANTVDLVRNPEGETDNVFSMAAPLPSHTTPSDGRKDNYKSSVIRYLVTYDPSGYAENVYYCSDAYNHFAEDADGISGIRYDRDELGRVTRLRYLSFVASDSTDAGKDDHYKVIGKRSGEAEIRYVYDGSSDCTELHMLDAREKAIADAKFGAVTVYQFAGHNEEKRSCYDAQGNLFLNEDGYAVRESVYDDQGNRIRLSFFGTDGEPVLCADGYAVMEAVYDDRGTEIGNRFFDTDGTPVLSANGYAGWNAAFDEHGNQIRCSFSGLSGEPVLHHDGYAGWDAAYDEYGNQVRVSFFGVEGEAVLCAEGYAGWDAVFDERGNETGIRYFGTDGKPILNAEGYAGWDSVFDERGNERKVSFVGTDGRLILESHGIAGYEAAYNERGNRTRVSYFGTDGESLLGTDGYAGFERVFDNQGNEIRCSFFGTDGALALERHSVAGWDSAFDVHGNEIRRCYFGLDGEPARYPGGYAAWESVYDEHGNEIRHSYFGTDGKPILVDNGYFGWDSVFDERGNEIRCSFFGIDGEPVLHVKGYAGWDSVFDELGNEIQRTYFDLNGNPLEP